MMSKYIDADELKDSLDEARLGWWGLNEDRADELASVIKAIDEMPESIVRCKDCKWWGVYDEPIKHCRKGMLRLPVLENEFCCKGERKETK